MKRHLSLVAAVLLITAQWAGPEPAKAALNCSGGLCLYEHANQGGCAYFVDHISGDFKKERFTDCSDKNIDDKISSFRNETDNVWIVLYETAGSRGARFCVPPMTTANIPLEFNDKASASSRSINAKPSSC